MSEQENSGFFRILPLYIVIFIGFVGYSLMITILTPMILGDTGGILKSFPLETARTIVLGIVLALYPLGQFFGSPVIGALSDGFGRRPVLLVSLVATILTFATLTVKSEKLVILVSRLPLLLLSLLACYYYPLYLVFLVAVIFATRMYYRKRFGFNYPALLS